MSSGLDVRSISVVAFVVYLALAVIMMHERATRRVYPGFDDWTISQLMLAVGMVLVSLRDLIPLWIPVLLGNGLILLAQCFIYDGLLRFFGLARGRAWAHFGLFALVMAGYVWFLVADDQIVARSTLFSGFTALLMIRIGAAMLTHAQTRREPAARLIAMATLVMACFSIMRTLTTLQAGMVDLFRDDRMLTASFLCSTVVSIMLVFGFLQLVQTRMEAELMAAQAQAEELANTDGLTGAWNRRRFEVEAAREMARARRYGQPLALILFDIDRFKQINDHHGHQAGDQVLTTLSRLVRGRIRTSDALVRWGGDEFLILAPMTTAAEAETLAEALRAEIAAEDFGPVGTVTLSVGVAEYRPPEPLDTWMTLADRGLYIAKAQGRDQVVVGARLSGNGDTAALAEIVL